MKTTLIRNVSVVNEGTVSACDVLIVGAIISKIVNADSYSGSADEVIDGRGKHLLPGLIDDQVHFREPGLTHKGDLYTESRAAVAGGIPIIKALREGLTANRIEWIAGIINGTTNFILSEMRDKGLDFAEALAEAQRLGYAEADPTFDIEGVDAAHKATLMSAIAFGIPVQFDHGGGNRALSCESIRHWYHPSV